MIEIIDKEFVNELGWNCRLLLLKNPEVKKVMIKWFRNGEPPKLILLSYTAFAMLGQAMSEAQDRWCAEIVTALEGEE
jgi:hypothetical protein